MRVPQKKVNPEEITPEVLAFIPEETARNYQVAPLGRTQEMLIAGMVNPDDIRAQEALKFLAKQRQLSLGVFLITPEDFELVLRRYSPFEKRVEAAVRNFNAAGRAGSAGRPVELEGGKIVAEEAPVIKLVAETLKEAVNLGASDIHFEPQQGRVRVRLRLDGELQEAASLPLAMAQPLVSRIKVLANLKIDENRVPQDGRFRALIFDREIDFRVSTFPTPSGEKAALRVLDPKVGLKQLDELGLTGHNLTLTKKAIAKPFGMILITGPTGSGKTTTLYALMQILNKVSVNIVSVEEPVEYSINGVNQSQVRPEIGYDFASGLRQILRQDPDMIMVGEIRDNETAGLAVNAALTGHIVLSTLHTNNAVGVIPRLLDMKIQPFLIPSALNLMVAQRLVLKLCDQCKKAEPAAPEILKIIREELPDYKGELNVYRAVGCPACKNKGRTGRMGLFEVLEMTPQMTEIIAGGVTDNKLLAEAKRQNMTTLRQDGLMKALQGLVGVEEVLRETTAD